MSFKLAIWFELTRALSQNYSKARKKAIVLNAPALVGEYLSR